MPAVYLFRFGIIYHAEIGITGSMLFTNVRVDPEVVVGNVTPALKVVTHCQLTSYEFGTAHKGCNYRVAEQLRLSNLPAAFTFVDTALPHAAQ